MSTPPVEPQRPAAARGTARRSVAGGVPVAPDEVAPVGRRFLAYVVDGAVLGAVYGIGTAVALAAGAADGPTPLAFLPLVLALLVGLGLWGAEAITGATVGGAALGIRTVAVRTGLPAGLLAILLRNLVVAAGALACLVGQVVVVVSGVWDREPAQRGWHDKAAGTLVVRAGALRPAGAGRGRRTADASHRPHVDARSAWETAVARGVDPGRPVPPVPADPTAPAAAEPPQAPPLAPPPPSAPTGEVATPPRPAFVDGPPPTAVVPVVPPPAPLGGGLVDVPAGIADAPRHDPRTGGPVIDVVPGGPGPAAPPSTSPGLVEVPPVFTGAVPLVPVARRPAPAPVGQPGDAERTRRRDEVEPAVAPAEGLGDVEHTRLRDTGGAGAASGGLGDLEHTRLRGDAPGPRDQGGTGVLRLVFDTGQRVVVEGDGLVGRDPSDAGATHVVAVDDPQRSVSKVHLAFGPADGGRLWVVDRGSTNGTFLVGPDGRGAALAAGARAVVEAGWTIRFGQRTARVERV